MNPKLLIRCLLSLVPLLSVGCATSHHGSMLPGIARGDRLVAVEAVPPVSDVIDAVRAELARAFADIDRMVASSKSAVAKGLRPQEGRATFTGRTQLVETNSGNLAAVFPFSGYTGSTLTPNWGVSAQSTSAQETTLAFSFRPERLEVESRNHDGHLSRALVALFAQVLDAESGEQEAIVNRAVQVTLTFSVVKTDTNGLGVSLVPAKDGFTSVGGAPLLGEAEVRTGVYTLALDIPLITPDPQDPRRVIEGVVREDGGVYLIERPYSQDVHRRRAQAFDEGVEALQGHAQSIPVDAETGY